MVGLILMLSGISAILYRAGGMDKETKHWIPVWLRQSWVRDWLCPICALLPLVFIHPSAWFILAYLILAGSLSTYWDFLFGWDNFWVSGFMCGIAAFPLLFCGFHIPQFLIRAFFLAIIWGGVNASVNNNNIPHSDFIEEYARGFSLAFSAIIFL